MIFQHRYQTGEISSGSYASSFIYDDDCSYSKSFPFSQHYHSFYELDYIISGDTEYNINSKSYTSHSGSMLFITPLCTHFSRNIPHSSSIECKNSVHLILQFSTDLVNSILPSFSLTHSLAINNLNYNTPIVSLLPFPEILEQINKIISLSPHLKLSQPKSLESTVDINEELHFNCTILMLISALLDRKILIIQRNDSKHCNLNQMQRILKNIIEHPEEKIPMKQASISMNMSYFNFCRTFKKISGETYTSFYNTLRICRAKEMLSTSNTSVTDISYQLGFGSVSYFNRVFKAYTDQTPIAYRNSHLIKGIIR